MCDHQPPRAKATVVLLHGLCLTKASWSLQVDYLARRWSPHISIREAALTEADAAAINATPLATKVGFLRALRHYNHYRTLETIIDCVIGGHSPDNWSRKRHVAPVGVFDAGAAS